MESQRETRRREQETPDIGASVFAGAVIFLAGYGLYKLFQKEIQETQAIERRSDRELINRIIEQELKS